MDITKLLSGYHNRMLEKFDKQANNEIERAKQNDVVRRGIEQIKKNTYEQYKMLSEGITDEDGNPFTQDELDKLIDIITLPFEYKLSIKTQNYIKNINETKENRKRNLSDVLNEVNLLVSYLDNPEEVTKTLTAYKIIENDKLNMELF